MDVNWLVQEDIFKEDLSDLFRALELNGNPYYIHKYVPFESEQATPFDAEQCVIVYGSLNLVRRIKRTKPWIPGYWCNFDAFCCQNYYAHYGKYLINRNYLMLPLKEVLRRKEELYDLFGDPLFVRPDAGDKPFTGFAVPRRLFESEINFLLSHPSCYPEILVVVAPFRKILNEWRFVVSDRVVTGSLYLSNDEEKHGLCENGSAFDFAQKILSENWKPDPIFVIDICETNNEIGLLEINSFSCSGFYAADKNKIVQEAARLALLELEDLA